MSWTIKPTDFIKEIKSDLCDLQKKIATDALRGVIEASPVDSGAFKGNHYNAVIERFFLNLKMERVWQKYYANH